MPPHQARWILNEYSAEHGSPTHCQHPKTQGTISYRGQAFAVRSGCDAPSIRHLLTQLQSPQFRQEHFEKIERPFVPANGCNREKRQMVARSPGASRNHL